MDESQNNMDNIEITRVDNYSLPEETIAPQKQIIIAQKKILKKNKEIWAITGMEYINNNQRHATGQKRI